MKGIFDGVLKILTETGLGKFQAGVISILVVILGFAICVAGYIIFYKIFKKLIHVFFRKLEDKKGKRIHTEFLERAAYLGLWVIIIISFLGWKNIGGSLLGSAAVITGVVGFAAQDVIKDILSGILISIYKPFDLGDRIELEDGTVGVVESITMRHVVITRIDTIRVVIPNSRINAASILNYSFGNIERSCLFKFPVSYDSDVRQVKKVISDAIKSSPYSIPGKKQKDGTMDYGNIYFIDLADSALVMAVTVYYESDVASEKLKDDIYTRVFNALGKNGIEIPYNHTSVIIKHEDAGSESGITA